MLFSVNIFLSLAFTVSLVFYTGGPAANWISLLGIIKVNLTLNLNSCAHGLDFIVEKLLNPASLYYHMHFPCAVGTLNDTNDTNESIHWKLG